MRGGIVGESSTFLQRPNLAGDTPRQARSFQEKERSRTPTRERCERATSTTTDLSEKKKREGKEIVRGAERLEETGELRKKCQDHVWESWREKSGKEGKTRGGKWKRGWMAESLGRWFPLHLLILGEGRRRSISFFLDFFLRVARHPADSDGMSNRWCLGARYYWPGYQRYHGVRTTLGQHCTALQSAVSL